MHQASLAARACAALPVGGVFCFRAYNKVLRTLAPRRTASTYFGATMSVDCRDLIQACIIHFSTWEPNICAVFETEIRPGDLVVDIGANIGFCTLLFSRLVGPNGAVVAIEASPKIAVELNRNLALNAAGNVRVANIAVSDRAGEITLYEGPQSNSGATTTVQSRGMQKSVSIPCLPLHEILSEAEIGRVAFIKIDIEGAEAPVLEQILNTLDRYPRKLSILVESSAHEALAVWRALFDRLLAAGFSAYFIENRYDFDAYLHWRAPAGPKPITALPTQQADILFRREA